MDERLKERLVGAAVLVSLAVIFVPMILGGPDAERPGAPMRGIPAAPNSEFSSTIVPLGEPATPLLDEETERRAARSTTPVAPVAPPQVGSSAVQAPNTGTRKGATGKPPATKELVGWVVQLGSFSNERNAKALRDRLRKLGRRAFVESARGADGVMTRVYVGPELSRERAVTAAKKLQTRMRLKGMVVRYPRD